MAEKTINLRGLKCPLPALRTRKALADPLAGIDIPNLLNQTGDALEHKTSEGGLITFRIRKR
jgi:tRNA 2-thiouridine synthesizing protein A